MTNVEKVNRFLDKAKTFYFLTTDGDQPKGRPFGFHLLTETDCILDAAHAKMSFPSLQRTRMSKFLHLTEMSSCGTMEP